MNNYILSIGFSFLYVLSFPPYYTPLLGFFAIWGVFFVLSKLSSIKELIVTTLLVSLLVSVLGVYWVIFATKHSFDSYLLGVLVLLGFSLLYSIFIFTISIPLYLLRKDNTKRNSYFSLYFTLVVCFSTADALKFYFLGGFPWFVSAYLWGFSDVILQIVSVIGVTGLSVATYCLIFSFVLLFYRQFNLFLRISTFSIFSICFISFYLYGSHRIDLIEKLPIEKEIPLRLVNTSIPQENKIRIQKLISLQTDIVKQSVDKLDKTDNKIILLPETSFIFFNTKHINNITNQIPLNSILITGAVRFDENESAYNSIFALNHYDIRFYDKQRLVPFGEKIPFSEYFSTFFNSFISLSNMTAGTKRNILNIDQYRILVNICFEALFPLEREQLTNVDFIFNSSNEAWFNNSTELEQNWSISRYRSIESGLPFVKVSNRGISGVYDIAGNEILKVVSTERDNIDFSLPVKKIETTFSKINYHVMNYILFFLYFLLFLFFCLKKVVVRLDKN